MAASDEQDATVDSDAAGEKIRIVLADDHAVVRSALRMLLEAEGDFEVVAEAGTVPDTVRYTNGHKPDVLLLDLNMPGGSTFEAIPKIAEVSPDTKIVVLTTQEDPAFAREAMRCGVLGFLLKDAADVQLVEAVRNAAAGTTYLQPSVGAKIASAPEGLPDRLTEREVEVLRLIALGFTNAEIGDELSLSVRTVESHRAHIQSKTGQTKRSELVRYALDHSLIETSPPAP